MKTTWIFIGLIVLTLLVFPVIAQDIVPNDTTKTVIQHYHIKGSTITFLDSRVIYGHCSDNYDIPDAFTGRTLGSKDETMSKFGISDPRITYMDEGGTFTDDINFTIKVPMSMNLAAVGIYNPENDTLLARGDTTQAIKEFCSAHPKDPDCSRISPMIILIGAAVLILIVGIGVVWYLKRKKGAPQKK